MSSEALCKFIIISETRRESSLDELMKSFSLVIPSPGSYFNDFSHLHSKVEVNIKEDFSPISREHEPRANKISHPLVKTQFFPALKLEILHAEHSNLILSYSIVNLIKWTFADLTCNRIRSVLEVFVHASFYSHSCSKIIPVSYDDIKRHMRFVMVSCRPLIWLVQILHRIVEYGNFTRTNRDLIFNWICESWWFENSLPWKLSIDPSIIAQRKFLHLSKRVS